MEAVRTESTDYTTDAWNRVLATMRFKHGEATFNSWLKPLNFETHDNASITLSAPTRFIKDWIVTHYLHDITEMWQRENSAIVTVDILVKEVQLSAPITEQHQQAIISKAPVTKSIKATAARNALDKCSSRLDPRFTFDNFVVGQSNELGYAAARSIAEADGLLGGSNPLFLYGGVGLGKTHLMQAIANHIAEHTPERTVLYLSAEKFMYQFIKALRDQDIVSFKDIFRSVDVLMIDDIQFICGKNSTQEEFFHTFNALIDDKKQLILSGDRSPSDLDGMEERIKSRLGWGLVADINATTFELRLGILQSKVENMNIDTPKEVLEFLARKVTSNVRELEGALNKVIAHSRLTKREITLEGTQLILRDLLRTSERSVTIEDIKKTVAEHFNIRVSDMHSARRARNIARPRQIAMHLSKQLTAHSLPEIGRKFGGKDHTTVMHAIRRIEELCAGDKEIADDVAILTRTLQD
jgi:chromosomal replication initiator protein